MNVNSFPNLTEYMQRRLADTAMDAEERAHIENFLLDERPPQSGVDLYGRKLKDEAITDLDNWQFRHRQRFVKEELNLSLTEPEQPWTFREENAINWLRDIDPRLYLIRVEEADWLYGLGHDISPETLREHIANIQKNDSEARKYLDGLVTRWNSERDKRPVFATTELEVEDIIYDDSPDWAEQLRDRLGLGHYSPANNRPIEIILMRYTVQEVLDSLGGYPAIPTVLDSDMSQYFFPSPIASSDQVDNPYYGHTVNLAVADAENDYIMAGVELLHPRIEYKPEHFFKMGVIARPFQMPLHRARSFHLPWLRLDSGRDDFGAAFFGESL